MKLWSDRASDYEYARSLNLPRGFQFLWAIDLIDADINIDGIQQVFFSRAVFFVPNGVEGYRAIGYPGRASVLERAVQTVFGERLGRARLEPRNDLDDVWDTLDAIEEEYFAYPDYHPGLIAFIESNIELFVIP